MVSHYVSRGQRRAFRASCFRAPQHARYARHAYSGQAAARGTFGDHHAPMMRGARHVFMAMPLQCTDATDARLAAG